MEIDECSVNGDSGAEEDEDEEISQGSGTESSSNNSSASSTTTDSGEESADADDQGTSTSETHSSVEEEEEENEPSEHPEERWETCVAGGTKVKLPQDLCEHASVFKEMLDYPRFWEECLSESQKESLYSFLPTFPKDCNIEAELDKSLDMLFSRETHRFGVNPLDDFHKHLSAGHFRPDIKRMRTLVKKAQKRKYVFEERKRAYELAGQLLKSRESLLSNAYKQGFSQPHRTQTKLKWRKPKPALIEERTQLRYAEEIAAINAEVGASRLAPSDSQSDDEDGSSSCLLTPAQASTGGKLQQQLQLLQQQQRKKKRTLVTHQQPHVIPTRAMHLSPEDDAIRPVYSTLQRVPPECGGVETILSTVTIRPELNEESYKAMLMEHKKRRARKDTHPELNTQGISLSDLMQRAQLGQKHKLTISPRVPMSKKRIKIEQQQQQQTQVQPQSQPSSQPQLQPQLLPQSQQQPQPQLQSQPQPQPQPQPQSQPQPQPQPQPQTQIQTQIQPQSQPQQIQQLLQQPSTSHRLSVVPIKLESDTNSHTSGDYSLHSTDDLKHSVIEQPDHKPPECLLAADEDEELDPEPEPEAEPEPSIVVKLEPSIIKHEPIEIIEQKYEIEPPAAQPPSTIMEEGPESHNEMSSPISAAEIKEKMEEMEYESEIKVENNIIMNEEISVAVSIPVEVEEDIDKKELDLDSIDMMQLPIQLDDGIDILADVKCEDGNVITIPDKDMTESIVEDIVMNGDELMQETHACFFSLIRDAFLSKGEYRMIRNEMKDAVILWQDNPISPLNDWYSLVPSWPALVPLALGFLAGELVYPKDQMLDGDQELVPYLENKGRGVYAWIGAGRDSDVRLSMLCTKFLLYKDSLVAPKPITPLPSISKQQSQQAQQQVSLLATNNLDVLGTSVDTGAQADSLMIDGMASSSPEWEPPKALCPTDWKVRPSTTEEREEFRRQERMRYAAPHKAFTYRMHGYSSVVGPVKGIYQHNAGSGLTKARGHSLLVPDRPNFVTILALVRDATARLPNGEGTRADICQLLKDSQYIQEDIFNNDKEGNLNSVVSGALDRLHYENDPCVRYYPKRKEWLYLHRARSESEFELFHQQLQGVPKNKKSSSGSSRSKAQQSQKIANAKEQASTTAKEVIPKKEKKASTQSTPATARKEQAKKLEDKVLNVIDQSISTADQLSSIVQQQQQQSQQLPQISLVVPTTTTTPITITVPAASHSVSTLASIAVTTSTPVMVTTSSVGAQTLLNSSVSATSPMPSIVTGLSHTATSIPPVEKECPVTVISTMVDPKPAQTMTTTREMTAITSLASAIPTVKKVSTNVNVKPVAVVKSTGAQSLLQSNQQHFPHHQIQVSTSAGLQTIRLSGHSVLQSAQSITSTSTTSVATIFPTGTKLIQSQAQQSQQQTVLSTQAGKSILQTSNLKQQQQQHVLPGKTLLASQIKLVSPGQIKSLLTGHGLQGQTIFIKQAPSTSTSQTTTQQTQQAQPQIQQRVVTATQQQQQALQSSGMQRIIAQIGGKPIAVQIQQSPQHQQQQQQHQQQQKVLAKVLTSTGTGQLISVESLLAQKGLKLATTAAHANQLARQGNKVIQTQYQVVTQAQTSSGQSKIIVSQPPQTQQSSQQSQQQTGAQQTVRMVTAQLAGKPIVLASSGGGKSVGVNMSAGGNVVLGKQTGTTNQSGQQPIILPSQLLNIKTLHGLKVIPTPAGLKTTGSAVYARVIAPTTITQTSQSNVVIQQQQQQQGSQQIGQQQQIQNAKNSPFGGS